jgi:hypothetical protein
MRGRGGGSGGSSGSSFSTGSSDNSGLIAGAIGYFGGSAAASGGTPTVGDGIKYGVKCSADDNSSYCQNVRMYNQFQMIVSIITTIIAVLLFFAAMYYIYTMYFSKKR